MFGKPRRRESPYPVPRMKFSTTHVLLFFQQRRTQRNIRSLVWFAGILMAIPLTIPIMNILVPVLGVATIAHQFHRLRAQMTA